MNVAGAAIIVVALGALGMVAWGLLRRNRSPAVALVGVLVAGVAAVGCWYAWTESRSLLFAIVYGLIAVGGMLSFGRQLSRRTE